jgi:hypothetical protein
MKRAGISMLAAALLLAGVAAGSTDKALIGAGQDINDVPGGGNGAEGVVTCPGGERALGGGIVTDAVGDIDLRASGPLDDSGTMVGTKDGDRPVSWYAAVSNFTGSPVDFRLFVVCAKANVVIEATKFTMPTGEGKQAKARCHGSRRAVGGGVIQNGGAGGSFVRESGPTDASGKFKRTNDGDVPRGWFAAMHNQGGSTFFKAFAVCAKGSDAKLEVIQRKVPQGSGAFRGAETDCPGSKRALGGGLLHSRGLDGYFGLTTSGPLDASGATINTGAGDKPAIWQSGIENVFGGTKAKFKVLAICE